MAAVAEAEPKPAAVAPTEDRVGFLDGMRALAIALVLWLHLWQISWLPNFIKFDGRIIAWNFIPETGFVGVDLFFFLSACCLTLPRARAALSGRPVPTYGHFAYRRAIKILPSYWLCLGILVCFFIAPFPDWRTAFEVVGRHLLFIHNADSGTQNAINGVLWSLAVEVQFYVAFPLVCRAFFRWPLWTYFAMCAVAIAYRAHVLDVALDDMAFQLNLLLGELDLFAHGMLAGALLAGWRGPGQPAATGRAVPPWVATGVAIGALVVMGAMLSNLYDTRLDTAYWPWDWLAEHRTHLAIGVFVFAMATSAAGPVWRWIWSNRLAVFISTISYNLYLWHQFIGRQVEGAKLVPFTTPNPHDDPHWAPIFMLVATVLSVVVATGVTYLIERPLLHHGPGGLWRRLVALTHRVFRLPPP